MQIECTAVLNRFLAFLTNAHLYHTTASFVCAVLNTTHEILKARPQFAYSCLEAFLKWDRHRPDYFTSLDLKNVHRNLKVILLCSYGYQLLSFNYRAPYASDLLEPIKQLATHYGARPHDFQSRLRFYESQLAVKSERRSSIVVINYI